MLIDWNIPDYTREYPLTFTPTGELVGNIDFGFLDSQFSTSGTNATMHLLKLLNWIFVSQYWLTLIETGQLSPVVYGYNTPAGVFAIEPYYRWNLSNFMLFDSTYNPFVNETLFQIYSTYLKEELLGPLEPVEFLPLSDTNKIQPTTTGIYRNYICSQRQIKGWFSLLISVFAADYAVIAGAYTLFKYIAGWLQQRKDNRAAFVNSSNCRGANLRQVGVRLVVRILGPTFHS